MSQMIFTGTVTSTCDEYSGKRIRVKLPFDPQTEPKDGYPFAFPLIPKLISVMPKVGEEVLVILSDNESKRSSRLYIGPIISQPQKMYEDKATLLDRPASLINSIAPSLETIEHFSDTFGAFPNNEDVSLIGRKSEDIILKDDEINIRCGVRNDANESNNKSLVGDILFNSLNPTYIQLKHLRGSGKKCNNLINLVGGNINLLSNKDASEITNSMRNNNNARICIEEELKKIPFTNVEERKKLEEQIGETFYKEADYDEIIKKLHQVPYGDVLVRVLEVMRNAILNHTHPWAQEPPTTEEVPYMTALKTWGESGNKENAPDLSSILLSDVVRIS